MENENKKQLLKSVLSIIALGVWIFCILLLVFLLLRFSFNGPTSPYMRLITSSNGITNEDAQNVKEKEGNIYYSFNTIKDLEVKVVDFKEKLIDGELKYEVLLDYDIPKEHENDLIELDKDYTYILSEDEYKNLISGSDKGIIKLNYIYYYIMNFSSHEGKRGLFFEYDYFFSFQNNYTEYSEEKVDETITDFKNSVERIINNKATADDLLLIEERKEDNYSSLEEYLNDDYCFAYLVKKLSLYDYIILYPKFKINNNWT